MGASSSTNVSKMMQTASIDISTEISQSSSTGASASNMISQVCNNVRAVAGGDNGWDNKVKSIENTCYMRSLRDGGKKSCSVPWTKSGDNIIVYEKGDETIDTNVGNYTERTEKLEDAKAWCGTSESNCSKCSNGEGRTGIWSEHSYDRCAELFGRTEKNGNSTTYNCVWMDDARTVQGKPTRCMPRCYNITNASTCNAKEDCVFQTGQCRMKNPNEGGIEENSGGDATGCRIKNINQSNSVKAVAKQLQDAAVTNVTQQQLTQNLKQVATAMTSGINFGNFSAAENIGQQVANASTRIRNSIKQTCGASGFAQNVVSNHCNQVTAESKGGNALGCEISDVVQENTMKVANDCTQKAVVSNKAVQDLQQTMDQLAVAKTVGIDIMTLFIAIAIICGIIVICATKAVGDMSRHITAIAGIFMLVAGSITWIISARDNGAFGNMKERGYGCFDFHSGPRGTGENTMATMNMKFSDGWGVTSSCDELDENSDCNGDYRCKWEERGYSGFCQAKREDEPTIPSKSELRDIFKTNCLNVANADTCDASPLCKWVGNFSTDGGKCEFDTGNNPYGFAYDSDNNVTAQAANNKCWEDEQCAAWYWDSNEKFDDRARKPSTVNLNSDLFMWKDGYKDEGDFFIPSKQCWFSGQPCCEQKACMQTGDPLSKECGECCSSGYNVMWVGKDGSRCEGKSWESCQSTDVGDYDIDCVKCNYKASNATKGTAYYYFRPPGQRKQIPAVSDTDQKRRVAKTLTCMPGVDSWGGVKADRAIDLRGVLGLTGMGLGVVTLIIAAYQYMTHKPPQSIAGAVANKISEANIPVAKPVAQPAPKPVEKPVAQPVAKPAAPPAQPAAPPVAN